MHYTQERVFCWQYNEGLYSNTSIRLIPTIGENFTCPDTMFNEGQHFIATFFFCPQLSPMAFFPKGPAKGWDWFLLKFSAKKNCQFDFLAPKTRVCALDKINLWKTPKNVGAVKIFYQNLYLLNRTDSWNLNENSTKTESKLTKCLLV